MTIEIPKSSKLDTPHEVEGTMKEAKTSLYELAKNRVRFLSDQEFSAWCREFGPWGEEAVKSPAVMVVWPRGGKEVEGKIEKVITHLEIVINKEKFQIDGEDYSDIIPFAIEHELYETWLKVKKGLGDGSDDKNNGFQNYIAKHKLSLRREFLLAEQAGLGEKIFKFHTKLRPEDKEDCLEALKKAKEKLGKKEKELSTKEIYEKIIDQFKSLVVSLIENKPENSGFKESPDDPNEHAPDWHQFGIITHTLKAVEIYQSEVNSYFTQWGIEEKISSSLREKIDGRSKGDLLLIGLLLHDLGKFARGFKDKDGTVQPGFLGHEKKSEEFVLKNLQLRKLFEECKLTADQIFYIARCAGVHFNLGKVKNEAKRNGMGYTIEFSGSEDCKKICMEIANRNPDFLIEIGVLFLCDCLAKTDFRINAQTDSEIEQQTEKIEQSIKDQDLNPQLINAIKQMPVNLAVTRKYFEVIDSLRKD